MISVKIEINEDLLIWKSAHRIKEPDKNGFATYKTDCGKLIKHNPSDGAGVLSKKIIDLMTFDVPFFDKDKVEQFRILFQKFKDTK